MEHTLRLPSQRPPIVLATDEAPPPHMVTFEQPDGSSLSLNYGDLRSVRYDPAGPVRLRFASNNVVLQGGNPLAVWRALRSRRVKRLLRLDRFRVAEPGFYTLVKTGVEKGYELRYRKPMPPKKDGKLILQGRQRCRPFHSSLN